MTTLGVHLDEAEHSGIRRRLFGKMKVWRSSWALGLCLLAVVSSCRKADVGAQSPAPDRPNIILMTIESLRADHVTCYGYERETTPHIDALAGQAIVYDQAYSVTSWTLPSHASIFTGLYPSAHKVTLPRDRLHDTHLTAAETLSSSGYQCAAVVGGPYLRPAFNLHQGFEYFDESVAAATNEAAHKDVTNPRMAQAMERFLREGRDRRRPFFLFAYYWDVHYDYIPPPPYDTMFVPAHAERIGDVQFGPIARLGRDISAAELDYLIAQYDGEIRCTDEHLGHLWELLRELGLWENTAIILTADHGEQFFEHSYLGHMLDLYVESLHVPLIIKLPGQSAGRRDRRLVNLIDLHPTILDLADCRTPLPYNGRSVLSEDDGGPRTTFFELHSSFNIRDKITGKTVHESDRWVGVRSGNYKLVHVEDTTFWQLYDVVADPAEHNPLDQAHAAKAQELTEHLERWKAAMMTMGRLWGDGPPAQLSPEEEKRLRALGYLP